MAGDGSRLATGGGLAAGAASGLLKDTLSDDLIRTVRGHGNREIATLKVNERTAAVNVALRRGSFTSMSAVPAGVCGASLTRLALPLCLDRA